MTDNLRQSAGDKLESNLKPESQKSTLEQVSDQAKGTADSVAGKLQPSDQKSAGQGLTDAVSGSGGSAQSEGEGILKQAQDGATSLANTASEYANAGIKQASDALGLNEKK